MWSHRGLGAEKCRESDLGFHRTILSDAGEQMERGEGGSRKAAAITKPRAGPWTLRLMYLGICLPSAMIVKLGLASQSLFDTLVKIDF